MNVTSRSSQRKLTVLQQIGIFATATATFSLSSAAIPTGAEASLPSSTVLLSTSVETTLNQPIAAIPSWCRYIPRRYRKYVPDCSP